MTKSAEVKHINAAKAFAGAGLMTAAVLSVALPALSIPATLAINAGSVIEIAGSLLAGIGAALWVEKQSA